MGMLTRLIRALLFKFKDTRWWEWQGRVKFVLWLAAVLGVIGWGLVRLEESSRELATEERWVRR
jgi:hypothetical protein